MRRILTGLGAAALLALSTAPAAMAAPVSTSRALSACTKRSPTALLSAADASWLGSTVGCMYSNMLHQQECGPQSLSGGCTAAGGEPSADIRAVARWLAPRLVQARSVPAAMSLAKAKLSAGGIAECPARYHWEYEAADSTGRQDAGRTLNGVAVVLKKSFFAGKQQAPAYFGAAATAGKLASAGANHSAVTVVVVAVSCQ